MSVSRGSWLVLGLGVIGLAAAVVILVRGRPSFDRRGEGDETRFRALELRVAVLEARLRGIGGSRDLISAPTGHLVLPTAPESPVEAKGQAAPRPATVARQVELSEAALQEEYFGELDARLASETRDPVWSAATEEQLRGSTQNLRTLISVDGAQCGSSMCRVETTVAEPKEEARAIDRFLAATTALLPEAVVREGAEPGRRIVYFARAGAGFPPMVAAPEAATR